MSVYNRLNNSASLDFGYILQNQANPGPFTVEVNYKQNNDLILAGENVTITLNAYVEFLSPSSGLSAGAPMTAQCVHEIPLTPDTPYNTSVPVKFNSLSCFYSSFYYYTYLINRYSNEMLKGR